MEQREAPCAHCKAAVTYPATEVGMPFTCPKCGLSFDLPDGAPARARPPSELKAQCPKCATVTTYLEEIAGQVISCSKCGAKLKLPGGTRSLEALLEPEGGADKKKKGGTAQVSVRSKKGFGRSLVPMGQATGPRLGGPEKDIHQQKLLIQGLVLLGVAAALTLGVYMIYSGHKGKIVDESNKLKEAALAFVEKVNFDDYQGIGEIFFGDDAAKRQVARAWKERTDKVQVRIPKFLPKNSFVKSDGDGIVQLDWTYTVTDKTGKSQSIQEERELWFRKGSDGRWKMLRDVPFTTSVK